jgi:DAK2 domain fusion protein YloV
MLGCGPMASPLDATTLRRSMELFEEALREHRDEIDSLNVFPIPDGDTGKNMLATQQAVVSGLASMDGPLDDLRTVGDAIARASLNGARGNSGVILSQVLRGILERLSSPGPVDSRSLAAALGHASREADRAVASPQDGTVLSVLRDAAGAATEGAERGCSVPEVLAAALGEARRSLERTRDVLPQMRRAGVVDAGAKGFVLLLAAFEAAVSGHGLEEPRGPLGPVRPDANGPFAPEADPGLGFEVQFLLEADETAASGLLRALAEAGESLVVVGGGGLYNVHVHIENHERAVALGRAAGSVGDVSITALRDLTDECMGGRARGIRVPDQLSGLVAVVDGAGLQEIFRSLGALVVPGGPAEIPSDRAILEAVEAVSGNAALVLPNHPDVVPAAERAAAGASKEVRVIGSVSMPAGIAAATAFDPLRSVEPNAAALREAAASVRAGEVRAGEGRWRALVDGGTVWTGGSPVDAGEALARRLAGSVPARAEIVTVISGDGAGDEEVAELVKRLRHMFPDGEVQVLRGAQAGSRYSIGVELE